MQVQQVMSANVTFCRLGSNLAAATELLWTMDVGALPVVDDGGNVLGIVTDRDICIALGTRNVPASDVLVDDVMAKEVWTCRPDDDMADVLRLMGDAQVRRLPVIDDHEKLCGIVSLNDLALHTGIGKTEVTGIDILAALVTICAPHTERSHAAIAAG
ncbi:MAG TPA: CBS domain-containing protein [Bryobacteraceae bacterium]|nr:CBS domain-containing protein [Bryobacteraceae bacterium]